MKTKNLQVDLNGLILQNPITTASGTYGFGREYEEFVDLNRLGAISIKGVTLEERKGNPSPRLVETPMGIINSVGLQNPGLEVFLKEDLPWLKGFALKVIANINGNTLEEYEELASRLNEHPVDALEVNISCPNVKNGGMAFGTDPQMAAAVVKAVRSKTTKHLLVKLSPNVTDIGEIARAVEEAGADAISLVNTFAGMAIDIHKRKPSLHRKYGGVSGPAIKPLALKKVYDTYEAVSIPILGMGGISSYEDALEFIMAGASAVAIGTANFVNPSVTMEILEGIEAFMDQHGIMDINDLIGCAHEDR